MTRSITDAMYVSDTALAFLNAMIDAKEWGAEEIAYFIEKPWKWNDEWEAWQNIGKPTDPDTPAFDKFAELLDA